VVQNRFFEIEEEKGGFTICRGSFAGLGGWLAACGSRMVFALWGSGRKGGKRLVQGKC